MNAPAPAPDSAPRTSARRFAWLSTAIVLLALALRVFYVFDAEVKIPIRGDSNDYVLYAWNLDTAGTFSSTLPGSGPVAADSYRGPGYPLLLAGAMRLAGDTRLVLREADRGRLEMAFEPPRWITIAYLLQAVCGALGVLVVILLARFWLPRGAALAAGLLLALWPHAIVFCATLLSETLFGTLLLLAVLLLAAAEQSRRAGLAALAGATFACAYLVNPIIALFPLLAAWLLAWRGARRCALVLLALFALGPLGWGLRNASLPAPTHGALQRAEQNFVQGSWPQFLLALATRFDNDISAQIVAAEGEEERTFLADRDAGFAAMHARMALDPAYYTRWYLLDKPFLLWDWGIRIGAGDIYFLETTHSPFERIAMLRGMRAFFAAANPWLFLLALAAALPCLVAGWRLRVPFALGASAWLVAYVTAMHDVLQAEPRYSIPYRAFEVLLALSALAWIARWLHGVYAKAAQART